MGRSTAVALHDDSAYIGTYDQGVWRQESLSDTSNWSQIATTADIGGGAVLALRIQERTDQGQPVLEAFAATTFGLFKGTRAANGSWAWAPVPIGDPPVVDTVTEVLPLGNRLLVGTANQGLWLWDGVNWTQYADIGV
jgi:hypothetical protein